MAVGAPAAPRQAALTLMRFRPEPAMVLGVICLVALSFLVIVPIGWLILTSFQDPDNQVLTLKNYVEPSAAASTSNPSSTHSSSLPRSPSSRPLSAPLWHGW